MSPSEKDQSEILKAVQEITALLEDYKAFQQEHREYFLLLQSKLQKGEGPKNNFMDPAKIWAVDEMLQFIESNKMEDEIDGYDRLKRTGEVYHYLKELGQKIAAAVFRLNSAKARIGKRIVASYEAWLANASEKMNEAPSNQKLSEDIETMKKALKAMQDEIALIDLKNAAFEAPMN